MSDICQIHISVTILSEKIWKCLRNVSEVINVSENGQCLIQKTVINLSSILTDLKKTGNILWHSFFWSLRVLLSLQVLQGLDHLEKLSPARSVQRLRAFWCGRSLPHLRAPLSLLLRCFRARAMDGLWRWNRIKGALSLSLSARASETCFPQFVDPTSTSPSRWGTDWILRGLPYMTSAVGGEGGSKKQTNWTRLRELCMWQGEGGPKIRTFHGRHIWNPP